MNYDDLRFAICPEDPNVGIIADPSAIFIYCSPQLLCYIDYVPLLRSRNAVWRQLQRELVDDSGHPAWAADAVLSKLKPLRPAAIRYLKRNFGGFENTSLLSQRMWQMGAFRFAHHAIPQKESEP
jgi:hypothetical protein